MSAEIKHRMLKCIAQEPRPLLFFTDGAVHETVLASHIETYAAELVDEGYIFLNDGRYYITGCGQAYLDKPTTMTEPRAWCAAATAGNYKPPRWDVREGADDHLQHRSRGV